MQSCYMCERQASSRKHVPPKCLFPEHEDLPAGFDFRKNLITVPSCEQHNSEKSADDELPLFIITLQHRGNSYKDKHLESKVMRTFNISPDQFAKMMNEIVPMQFTGLDGEQFESAMFKIALDRFDRAMHHLACGVYYHHNERK